MALYVPPLDHQSTPHNCGPSAAAMCVSRDWLGSKIGGEGAIRTYINSHFGITDSDGTTHSQTNAAILALYGTPMTYRYNFPFAEFGPCVDASQEFQGNTNTGRGANVSIVYTVLHGTPFDHAPGFNGRHRVYVNERRYNSAKSRYEFLVLDPVASAPAWWPSSLLKAAMEAAGTEASFTRSTTSNVKKVLCANSYLISTRWPNVPPEVHSLSRGDLVTVTALVNGTSWSGACVGDSTGKQWHEVTALNGTPIADVWTPNTGHSWIAKNRVEP